MDICFDHTRGQCSRGDSCRFSHHLPLNGQIPPRPKTAGVCFDFTKGICKRGCVPCFFGHSVNSPFFPRPKERRARRMGPFLNKKPSSPHQEPPSGGKPDPSRHWGTPVINRHGPRLSPEILPLRRMSTPCPTPLHHLTHPRPPLPPICTRTGTRAGFHTTHRRRRRSTKAPRGVGLTAVPEAWGREWAWGWRQGQGWG
jgi:hypothetical protein